MIQQQAIDAIDKASQSTACHWWCEMNAWRWPETLPGKPEGFDDLPESVGTARFVGEDRFSLIQPLMGRIVKRFGKGDCLDAWNMGRVHLPD